MTESESGPDLSAEPSTDGSPATEAPVVAGAGETFDDLDSATPLTVDGGPTQPGGQGTGGQSTEDAAEGGPDPTAGAG
jgi:hypothetical protein